MKVDQIIGAVLLRMSGGKPNTDLSVQPWDIKEYIPDAINQAMGVRINEEYGLDPSVYPNGLFVNLLPNIPVSTNSRNLSEAVLPQRPLSVRGGKSVVSIGEEGGKTYTRILHDSSTLGAFYWKTRTDITSYDVEGQTIVFYNLPASVVSVFAKIVVHIETIGMDDEIFVPSGMENTLIDLVYSKAMEQRSNPRDTVSNSEDIK